MKIIICSGFGHREFYGKASDLKAILENLIINQNVTDFFTGGIGEFDSEFAMAVKELQHTYTHIRLTLVKPYFSNKLNTNKEIFEELYQEIIIPDILSTCHPKAAITKRNKWIIEKSDFVVFYICREFGGAYTALKYAKKLANKYSLYNLNS